MSKPVTVNLQGKLRKLGVFAVYMLLAVAAALPATVCAHAETSPPSVSARSAILIETSTGRVLFEKDADTRRPMASTTKIMTTVVALENGDLNERVVIPSTAVGIEGSSIYLYTDEELTLGELLYAVMLESANDAATAVAIEIAGSVAAFAELMNRKAAELGMANTCFANPHGLDHENHYTTARDLATLTRYAMQNPIFREICATRRKTIPLRDGGGVRLLLNHNRLLRLYPYAIGVKTGFTKRSGRCLVSAAERDGVELVAVTLNASDDWNDHTAMLEYGFSQLECVTLAEAGTLSYALPVVGGTSPYVFVNNLRTVTAVLPKERGEITCELRLKNFYYAPVLKSQPLGKAVWHCDGNTIAECELTASFDIPRQREKTIWEWLAGLFAGFKLLIQGM
ncbi:MAG: D-alanyl-D-alanine carboxypeptidase family protein [Eubacteriales bacterium]|nr:D-alanyl-D-alanine carboxypeptidase [Clostridiales bacterium]